MAMVNPMMNIAVANPNVKDSRWLTLEVCREFQRNKCTRTENECKFAHPPPHVEVQNGRVIACFDSIKGKCQRKDPPCKYLHPPQHLREQLLQNGRNNLILRNLQLQAAQAAIQPYVPSVIPMQAGSKALAYPTILPTGQYPLMAHPYISSTPSAVPGFNPYLQSIPGTMTVPGNGGEATMVTQQIPGVIPTPMQAPTQQKVPRPDRLEGTLPGVVPPYKRMAVTDAKGIPMTYQPSIGAYQHAALMQLGQQPFVPVTWQLTSQQIADVSLAGHPPSVPRF